MQGGGPEETIFTLNADVSPLIEQLVLIPEALATTDAAIATFADTLAGVGVSAAGLDAFATSVTTSTQSLAGLTVTTQTELDLIAQMGRAFSEGTASLNEFVGAGIPVEQVLAEITRMFALTAMSEKELVAAGVNMDAITAVLDNVAGGMTLLAAATKATADGFTVMEAGALNAAGAMGTGLGAQLLPMKEELAKVDAELLAMDNAVVGMDGSLAGADGTLAGFNAALLSAATDAEFARASVAAFATEGPDLVDSAIGMVEGLAGVINQFFLLVMVIQMAATALGNFITEGANAEHTFNIIQTSSGATAEQMSIWKDSLANLGQQFGFTLDQMAQGMLLVTRSGFQGADAITVLTRATMLANATGSDLTSATDLLTLSMDSYGASASQATAFSNDLYTAWKNSRMTLQEFTSALGPTIGDAKALGISFADLVNAEAVYSKSTGDSAIATREFQSFISGLNTFAAQTPVQLATLAGSFDRTKFAAMDFTQKLADLGKFADGNVATFTKLIGGVGDAKTVMDNLNISTDQLAKNAAAVGVSFSPAVFNSDNAAQKLLYLLTIVDFSASKFAALTDGTKATNAALSTIGPSLDAAGQKAFNMSSQFNMAQFKSEDLSQKLHQLADFLGGTGSAAFLKAIGGANNLQIALFLMGLEADKTHQPKVDTTAATQHVSALKQHLIDLNGTTVNPKVDTTNIDKLKTATDTTASDVKTQVAAVQSAWSTLADKFVTTFGPTITTVLGTITTGIDLMANHMGQTLLMIVDIIKGDFAGAQKQYNDIISQMKTDTQQTFQQGIPGAVAAGAPAIQTAVNTYLKAQFDKTQTQSNQIKTQIAQTYQTDIPNAITAGDGPAQRAVNQVTLSQVKAWKDLSNQLTGHSTVPDMMTAIATAILGGMPAATTAATTVTTAIQGVFATEATAAFQSGLTLSNQFAAGITAGQGAAVAAASGVAAAVAAQLAHHSPPKEGPLKDDDKWGGRMVDSFAVGMTAELGKLQAASLQMAKAAGGGINPGGGLSSSSGMGGNSTNVLLGQILSSLRQGSQQATIGHPSVQGQGYINQNFGSLNFNGVQNMTQLYTQFNRLAGLAYEEGLRGNSAGLGF
jgi:hypothetical protein